MSPASTAYAAYRSAEIETVTQKDLLVRLFQGAEKFIELARQAMVDSQLEVAMTNCRKTRDIFIELMATLNFEQGGELAKRLKELYTFIIYQVSEASLSKNPDKLKEILPIIKTLREGWEKLPDEHANVTSIPQGNGGHSFNISC
jgi:flagellar protein FliS